MLDRVAVGGMAEVYLAKSFGASGFEKLLAIKRILPSVSEEPEFVSMFVDEARVASYLDHGSICPIYELGRIGASYYLAMEFVWGKDILQVINRFRKLGKRPPFEMVAWIGSKVAFALDYAHRKKDETGKALEIIHRDVSPQNVIISYEGDVKLIDFGIAKAASRTTRTQAGVLKGKSGYMSPEQVKGMNLDPRSDVFALGTCLYELLTCERLFKAETEVATLERVRHAQVPSLHDKVPNIPNDLVDIVTKALAEQPYHRWATAAEMGTALQTYLHNESGKRGTGSQRMNPWGQAELSAWMKQAFAEEIEVERGRFKAAQNATPARVMPESEFEQIENEATLKGDATQVMDTDTSSAPHGDHVYFRSKAADQHSEQAKLLAQEPTRMLSPEDTPLKPLSRPDLRAVQPRHAAAPTTVWQKARPWVWGVSGGALLMFIGYVLERI